MGDRKRLIGNAALLGWGIMALLFFPLTVLGAESATTAIGEAKAVLEQARQAGAEKSAPADLAQARSWLAQAEKEYEDSQSVLSRTMKLVLSDEAKTKAILYMADMAATKGRTAMAKAKKAAVTAELQEVRKDLADFQTSLEVMTRKLAEAEAAKAVKAKAEAQLAGLAQAKQEVAALEEKKKKELAETQKKAAELEALRQKELQQAQLLEAQKAAEKALSAAQRAQEAAAQQTREEQLAGEREKMAAMESKLAAMEREKAMLADAAKLPQTTVKTAGGEIVLTLPVMNLFNSKNELHSAGKGILDQVGAYLKKYAVGEMTIRGYADNVGKAAANQALSEKRAQKVKEYLAAYQNIPAAEITTEGLGSEQPVASNATEVGRALNRRVEIAIPTAQ
ncbi:MAG: OmpA family protein [Deltaproteobacteria bacterium]|nr:OmpA family protein [Deltaproteobacteria bacterium]